MPKPKKIKKKKSFMFTTRHQSDVGIMSFVLGIASCAAMIACVITAFLGRGTAEMRLGGVGMFAALGDILGIVSGIISLGERDIYLWLPRAALIINIAALIIWNILIVAGARGA